MIEYLSNWILQIIIYMILAMLVDLILPSSTLKQYVKLVVGLLLILIILQPILSIFKVDVHQIVDQIIRTNTDPTIEANIENQMNQQKSEIDQIQAAYVLEEMVVHMQNLVEEELQETYSYQIVDLEATWTSPQPSEQNELEHVDVQLAPSDSQQQSVEKVNIQIGETTLPSSEAPNDGTEIKMFLAEEWGVEEDIIQIGWKEE
ncbi:stage III sporulation protein AF [Gracilibacillus kekensis]|uniref:Stage III sporulation protein AF n=1 Tax=Gracilibacillus kekensis TaxID=1027249 RepID=A0A1M7P6U7_9BACI|nr:stage III sporulation protein AF [Gracilibacillus kekensis]SHN12411.1 stage III sporulation protein AF [Gracilibacillus kekensis]